MNLEQSSQFEAGDKSARNARDRKLTVKTAMRPTASIEAKPLRGAGALAPFDVRRKGNKRRSLFSLRRRRWGGSPVTKTACLICKVYQGDEAIASALFAKLQLTAKEIFISE